ncbi:hypothetical protein JCM19992_27000 [Thermostilla marina]
MGVGALTAACAAAHARAETVEETLRARMEKRVYRNDAGESLPYRLLVPEGYDAGKKYPLILFLHGAGERGDDNALQLKHAQVLHLAADPAHPCFVVAPQCPVNRKWVEVAWSFDKPHETPEKPSYAMRLTLEILDALEKEFSIDPDRRYVTGLSMGGFGTFDILVRRPNYFAAAIPLCGGADDGRAAEFKHVPIWVFHGEKDPAVPVARSRSVVAVLKNLGADVRYTEYPGAGHNIWERAYYEPGLREWLFAHVRKPAE